MGMGLNTRALTAINHAMAYTPITPSDVAPGTTRFVQHSGAAFLIARDGDGETEAGGGHRWHFPGGYFAALLGCSMARPGAAQCRE